MCGVVTMNIPIIQTSLIKFGQLWDKNISDLIYKVVEKLDLTDVDAAFVANVYHHATGEELHIDNTACINEEGASGAMALRQAAASIMSGQCKCAIVLGVEKATDLTGTQINNISSLPTEEKSQGATVSSQFALMAQKYMHEYGIKPADLASVASLNHKNAMQNPYAQFASELSAEAILQSPMVADPIHTLECAPHSDGAAAVVMCHPDSASSYKVQGHFTASLIATDYENTAQRASLTSLDATKKCAKQISMKISKAEVYDIYPISELLAVEDLGFAKKGEAWGFIKKNKDMINASGGLKACGHAVAATGVRQAIDVLSRLKASEHGLTHSLAGTGRLSVVNIFKK